MKEVPLQEWAKRLLEDQINRLAELRNANPRDPAFRLWRQTTLTVIQRLWPGNLPRSEQFRRIAFTTPSAKASRNQVREHYERGCLEAVSYLRGLMLEIDGGALSVPADRAHTSSPPDLPMAAESPAPCGDTSMLAEGLVGSGPLDEAGPDKSKESPPPHFISPAFDRDPEFRRPAPRPPSPIEAMVPEVSRSAPAPEPAPQALAPRAATPQAPRVPPTPAPVTVRPTPTPHAPAAPKPAPVTAARPTPTPPAAAPPPRPPAAPIPPAVAPVADAGPIEHRPPRSARRNEKRPLKEMLGFVDAPASPVRTPAPVSRQEHAEPRASTFPTGERQDDWFEPAADAADFPEAELEPDPFEHDEEEAVELADEDEIEAQDEVGDSGDDTVDDTVDDSGDDTGAEEAAELLRTSPVFTAQARPQAAHRSVSAPLPSGTAVANVLNALAADVTRLGVPEGHRAATRAALIGLGRQFDQDTANWSSVRQAIGMALEYPALARLLIPTLVPYLDLE